MEPNNTFYGPLEAMVNRFRAVLPLLIQYRDADPKTIIIDDPVTGVVTVADLLRCSAIVAAWDQINVAIVMWHPPQPVEEGA